MISATLDSTATSRTSQLYRTLIINVIGGYPLADASETDRQLRDEL